MTEQHPIPPELMEEWIDAWYNAKVKHANMTEFVAIQAARWGADQELEACCKSLTELGYDWAPERLCAARRPKPPSLKEQALAALSRLNSGALCANPIVDKDTIRRALEQLDD